MQAAVEGKQDSILAPLPDNQWTYEAARHLLFRTGFGGTPQQVERLHAMGLKKAVAHVMDFSQQSDAEFELEISTPASWGIDISRNARGKKLTDPEKRKARQEMRRKDTRMYQDLRQWWMKRIVTSKQPLEENLTLFWHGLFSTGYRTVQVSYGMHQQNELFRDNAAGNYADMLHGIIHDPAMLRYLDNNTNLKGRPNENLAREIMELFAMGEGCGYTENDIKEGARALTGNTFDRLKSKYHFNARTHDNGDKTIFGKTGNFDGDQFVDLILEQEATPAFIAERLFAYFAYSDPDPKTVKALSSCLYKSKYELAPMLKIILTSKAFYSDKARGTMIKSPVHLVAGTLRTLGISADAKINGAVSAAASMEQDLFQPPNVKGWEGGANWINSTTLFTRQNFSSRLVYGSWSKKNKRFDQAIDIVSHLKSKELDSESQIVDLFARTLFVQPVSSKDRQSLIEFLKKGQRLPPAEQWIAKKTIVNKKLQTLLVMMLSMPQYQLS
ncbi:MAG: DUF1800 domain-containing protein [Fuerstiella sp.]|nr:DUF1800 domain-containing protein [Fuerstiella sp.]MCP4854148.1 DUF1800 domain-containing protein [Fuerstiella sp.]